MTLDMSVNIAGLHLKNPIMPASGTFGFGEEYADFIDLNRLGAIVVKSVTLAPRAGNPPPRLAETAAGMLNSIAWQNPGIEVFIRDKLPFLRRFDVPVIVNVAGSSIEEYVEVVERLNDIEGVAAFELNISCPNVHEGGVAFGTSVKLASQVTAAAAQAAKLPLIIKLSPNVTAVEEFALAVEAAGAQAVSLINCPTGMAIDIQSRRPVLGNIVGGLSGPAIKPIALYQVWRVAQAVKIPVIGMGGIASATDAIEFLLAGASAVAVGMNNFIDPRNMLTIIDDLERYLKEHRIDAVSELIGALRK
ncbi:dihydroorotate dehydrogenase [Candidatus Formimonas warabiya]|uniref:Dihydroorotate dehydrogenase n=1 Tax=Formimonas warabiya TaxID=1761012 RepID=A0A3G1KVS7_FORW1|nr:dihydroorotate dehydrogenase [Candidatus Formimonas warabiya]ATW26479.1 dihydroorotate dehydrogenase B catalytic subunit [Candidatus Formimonas warabiya]